MPKLKITKTFPFAHRGCEVVTYHAGTEIDTDDQELIDTILAEKWGHRPRIRSTSKPDGTPQADGDDQDDDTTDPVAGEAEGTDSNTAAQNPPAAQ